MYYSTNKNNPNALSEFKFLIESAGYTIKRMFTQTRNPTANYFFGEGFWDNFLIETEHLEDVEAIVVNTTLNPLQFFDISQKLTKKFTLIDTTTVILEIFSNRASTEEAILQIELAKLKYQLPFAKADLIAERVSGERLGFMQSGELRSRDLESAFKRRETNIKFKLEKIRKQRQTRRKERVLRARQFELITLSLLGYTNAGKSSMLNALTNSTKKVEVANKYFTTLSTTSRRFNFFDLPVITTDTVGFFEMLPATLIEAFRSTLEESLVTDHILLLVDVSDDVQTVQRKFITSLDTLSEIDRVLFSKVWIILTKTDLMPLERVSIVKNSLKDIIESYALDSSNIASISSLDSNFTELFKLIEKYYPKYLINLKLDLNNEKIASLRSKLYEESIILSETYQENILEIQLESRRLEFIKSTLKQYSINYPENKIEISSDSTNIK